MRKSLLFMWVVALAGLVSLAACERPSVEPQFTLRVGFFPVQDYLPYLVMRERGLGGQHGLRFEESSYPGGAAILDAMAAGSVDMGYLGSVPILLAAQRGLVPSMAVPVAVNNFADPDHTGVAVLVPPAIRGWKDLAGKQIAVNAVNSLNDVAFKGRLVLEGLKSYTPVEIPFANMGLAVAGGNVAAAVMSEPFLTQSLLRGDGKLLGWIIGGPPFERIEMSMIVFRAEFLRDKPQAVKALLRAHLQAVEWMSRHDEEARAILARRLNLDREVGRKIHLLYWPLNARNDPTLLERMQSVLANVGLLNAPIPARRLYDETLLNEVLADRK